MSVVQSWNPQISMLLQFYLGYFVLLVLLLYVRIVHKDSYKVQKLLKEVEGPWILQGFKLFGVYGVYMKGVHLRNWMYGPKFDNATFLIAVLSLV